MCFEGEQMRARWECWMVRGVKLEQMRARWEFWMVRGVKLEPKRSSGHNTWTEEAT